MRPQSDSFKQRVRGGFHDVAEVITIKNISQVMEVVYPSGLISQKSGVRIPHLILNGGACTKALAMSICNQREVGSIPIISTK